MRGIAPVFGSRPISWSSAIIGETALMRHTCTGWCDGRGNPFEISGQGGFGFDNEGNRLNFFL